MNGDAKVKIDIKPVAQAFVSPEQSRHVVEGALQAGLLALANALLPQAAAIIPEYGAIRRSNWKGAQQPVRESVESFRHQAEVLTSDFGAETISHLRRARMTEQALGHVARSPLYDAVAMAFANQPQIIDWKVEFAQALDSMQDAEREFGDAVRRLIPGPKRARSFDALLTKSQEAMEQARGSVLERCRLLLCHRLAAYTNQCIERLSKSRESLVAHCSAERSEERRRRLADSDVSHQRTSARHDTSISLGRSVIESFVQLSLPYLSREGLDLGQFWGEFGSWASRNGALPAEEEDEGESILANRISEFLRDQARNVLQPAQLAELYRRTGETIPLARLRALSEIPVELMPLEEMDEAYAHMVRVAQHPGGVDMQGIDATWTRATGENPNRIALVQDLQGFSARAFLGGSKREWRSAVANKEKVLNEASTPLLQDAMRDLRILERFDGELPAPDHPRLKLVAHREDRSGDAKFTNLASETPPQGKTNDDVGAFPIESGG